MSIKEFFQSEWSQVADAWQTWQHDVRAQTAAATGWVVLLSRVAPGMRILDLASGVGEPALELARRVGAGGQVVATDLVAGPLEFVARAARAEGLDWLSTHVADMEALPFPNASFDLVTCRFGLMFSPDTNATLREVLRVLVPGGRATFLTWGPPTQPLFESTLGVLGSPYPTASERPGPFRFSKPDVLRQHLLAAGFTQVEAEERRLAWPFHGSTERYWQMFSELSGPHVLEGKDRRDVATRAVNALKAFRTGESGEVVDPGALVVGCTGVARQ